MTAPEPQLSDRELVARCISDKDQYHLLVDRFYSALDRYAFRLGARNQQDRNDILQEVFIKVYVNLNAYDPSFPLSSWLYRIAHNETMTFFRKRKVRPEPLADETLVEQIADDTDLTESFATTELHEKLRRVLQTLDPKYRDVLILRYLEERSYEEIADILEKPPGTVATLINRAKERLKEALNHTPL